MLISNTPAVLRAMRFAAWAERDTERAAKARPVIERDQLAVQNDRLRHLIRQLQRMQFGRRSEKLDPDQFNLVLEDLEQAIARRTRAEKRRAARGSLPEHLPRVEVIVEPEDTACRCCGGVMQVIGEDRLRRLDMIPAQHLGTPGYRDQSRGAGLLGWLQRGGGQDHKSLAAVGELSHIRGEADLLAAREFMGWPGPAGDRFSSIKRSGEHGAGADAVSDSRFDPACELTNQHSYNSQQEGKPMSDDIPHVGLRQPM